MKFKLLVGTLIVSASMCTQSYGFDLLGRMLGLNYHGGGCCEPSCCDTGYTGCGHDYGCGYDSCCDRGHGLFGGFKGRHHGGCCDPCGYDPCACGHDYGCGYDKGCGYDHGCNTCNTCDPCNTGCKRRFSLFGWLFGGHRRGCCNPCDTCGCGGDYHYGPTDLPAGDQAAPVPPAPVVDPSASARYPMYIRPASRIIRN
ncbi:MAG: hypothetical protein MPJ50_10680 [Pirellulales bacterium]|nr:hypothetical protein [Pirellulales bacterium]